MVDARTRRADPRRYQILFIGAETVRSSASLADSGSWLLVLVLGGRRVRLSAIAVKAGAPRGLADGEARAWAGSDLAPQTEHFRFLRQHFLNLATTSLAFPHGFDKSISNAVTKA